MGFTYRDTPLPSDCSAIAALLDRTGFFRRDEIDVAVELIEEYLAKGPASGYYFWFADGEGEGNSPSGYVCYGPTPCTIGSFDLYWIAVDKGSQGHGLGRVLAGMAERSAAATGGRRMYVETSGKELYAPTQAFYRSVGYAEAARLPDFYDTGDDKVIFQKNIGSGT
jgi:ribosomal protein S18 acetylase RimI-like enzyme